MYFFINFHFLSFNLYRKIVKIKNNFLNEHYTSLININQSLMAIICSITKNQTNTSELS